MKKFSFVLAALAAVAFAMPSIASAQDAKPGMKKEGMMHHGKPMMMHHHHHTMMKKKMMMKKKGM